MQSNSTATKLLSCFISLGLVLTAMGQDTTFTYQGELSQDGNPANGVFNLSFLLWDLDTSGNQVGNTEIRNGVSVAGGRFSVELDFGAEAFTGAQRWLEIEVNGFKLTPRTRVTRTPYSVQTRGIFVDENEEIGLGTTNPAAKLDVLSSTTDNGNNTARFRAPNIGPNSSHIHFGSLGDWYIRSADDFGKVVLQDTGGVVGIGTSNPGDSAKLTVVNVDSEFAVNALSLNDTFPTLIATNAGTGGAIWAQGSSDSSVSGGGLIVAGNVSDLNISIDANEIMARDNGAAAGLLINREGGDVIVGSASGGSSKLITPVLQITGGSDFSEMFDVGGEVNVKPGMVVVIDPKTPGRLVPSTEQNDRKVAGIISGAGGVATGMTMGHDGTIADGAHPVALSGRVYCFVDTTENAIEPGDMLTTSSTPGHAMKATDVLSAAGSIIGKAMTPLKKGEKGLVLVLVNLQ